MISQEHSIKKLRRILHNWKDDMYLYNYINCDHKDILAEQYKHRTGKELNIDNPLSYNEKLQWMKLYWRDPRAYLCADKYTLREIVVNKLGPSFVNQLICRWTRDDDIDFSQISTPCLLKASHASGFNVVLTDLNSVNQTELKSLLSEVLNIHYYAAKCEWVYEKAEPSIMCEPLYEIENGAKIDYKFHCFDGKVKMVHILNAMDVDRKYEDPKAFFVDRNGDGIPAEYGYQNEMHPFHVPNSFYNMIQIAEELSKGFPHVRVDLYMIQDAIRVGELTFFPGSGYDQFKPESFDYTVGKWLKLPERGVK